MRLRLVVARVRAAVPTLIEWAFLFAIVHGIHILLGNGWAWVAAGALGLLNLTADAWLPALSLRHGRRNGTDARSRNS